METAPTPTPSEVLPETLGERPAKNIWWLIVGCAVLAAGLMDFIWQSDTYGLAMFGISLILTGGLIAVIRLSDLSVDNRLWVWLGFVPVLGFFTLWHDSVWMYWFNTATIGLLLAYFTVNLKNENGTPWLSLGGVVILRWIELVFDQATVPIERVWKQMQPQLRKDRRKGAWLRGFGLGVPIVLVILGLLASGDAVFRDFLRDIFGNLEWLRLGTLFKHIFIIFYFFVFSGMLYATIQSRRKSSFTAPQLAFLRRDDKDVLTVIALMVIGTLFVYLLVQLRYLIGGADLVEELGISYKKYARSGFYQLLLVTFITFIIAWLLGVRQLVKDAREKIEWEVRVWKDTIISAVLALETGIVLFLAGHRLWLYIDKFAWAPKRFYLFEGMLFLGIMIALFLIHLFYQRFTLQNLSYLFTVLFAVNILVLNLIKPDYFIATNNVNAYVTGDREEYDMDYDYTAYVSADGADAALRLFDAARTDEERRRSAWEIIEAYGVLSEYRDARQHNLLYYNRAKERAYEILTPRIKEIRVIYEEIMSSN